MLLCTGRPSLHLIPELIAYFFQTIGDVVAGRLRSPSSLMELSSLEISPRLLQSKNFRLPPLLEIGALFSACRKGCA